jgi:hypothetical protein
MSRQESEGSNLRQKSSRSLRNNKSDKSSQQRIPTGLNFPGNRLDLSRAVEGHPLSGLGAAVGLLLLSFGAGLVYESLADASAAAVFLLTGASLVAAGLLLLFLTLKR